MYFLRGLTGRTRKKFSTVAVQHSQKQLWLRWTLTVPIRRDILEEFRTIDRGTGHTKTVVDIDRTMVRSQCTSATCKFRLVTNVAAVICALSAEVRIIAPPSVFIASHVMIEVTIVQTGIISKM